MAQPKRVQPAWQDAVCGGLGAMGASATVHAIDSFKIRLQLQGELDPHALRLPLVTRLKSIYQVEGLRGMYRGLSASMLRQSIYSTTRFGLHGALKNAINVYDATLFSYIGVKVATAMAAGAGGAMLSSPCDLVMVRMQADGRYPPAQRRNYRNVFDGLTRIAREDGLGGLWRGAVPNIKRAMIVTASQFVSYEKVKDLLCKYPTVWQFKKDHFATHFTASLMAGFMTTIFSLPVDTIRTRIFNARQDTERVRVIAAAATTAASGSGGALTLGAPTFAATGVGSANIAEGSSGHGGRPHMETPKAIKYDGAIDCMVRTLRTEGVRGLYKGFVPHYAKVGPYVTVMFVLYEQINNALNKLQA